MSIEFGLVVVEHRDQLLLGKKPFKPTYPSPFCDGWDFPFGWTREGEDLIELPVRLLEEQAGLVVVRAAWRKPRLLPGGTQEAPVSVIRISIPKEEELILRPVDKKSPYQEWRWFSMTELMKLGFGEVGPWTGVCIMSLVSEETDSWWQDFMATGPGANQREELPQEG